MIQYITNRLKKEKQTCSFMKSCLVFFFDIYSTAKLKVHVFNVSGEILGSLRIIAACSLAVRICAVLTLSVVRH